MEIALEFSSPKIHWCPFGYKEDQIMIGKGEPESKNWWYYTQEENFTNLVEISAKSVNMMICQIPYYPSFV